MSSKVAAGFIADAYRRANRNDPPVTDETRVRSYEKDPIGFCRDVLGVELWSRQAEIVEAAALYDQVSVVSGHKVGKSRALACIALWFYCSFPGARVILTSSVAHQIADIIWREIKQLVRHSRLPIPGADSISELPSNGLKDPNTFSEIRGYTGKDVEAFAGISGGHILYLVDEASGIKPAFFSAIEGNRAGGHALLFLISNPTRGAGEFYDSHHRKSAKKIGAEAGYHTFHIDSRESPNITGEWRKLRFWDRSKGAWVYWHEIGDKVPGLATQKWVERRAKAWGEDSPEFKVRVAGLFAVAEAAKAFSATLVAEAETRWLEIEDPQGRLWIGCDPAGDGEGGDESAFAPRRGQKIFEIRLKSGLNEAGHIAEILDIIETYPPGKKEDLPVVVLDSEGEVGWKVLGALRAHAAQFKRFEVVRVRSSEKPKRQPMIYKRHRDELAANFRTWLRKGGAIPTHEKLEEDLNILEWERTDDGKQQITPKKKIREELGRSTDSGDAAQLSVWEPTAMQEDDDALVAPPPNHGGGAIYEEIEAPTHDPYSSLFV
jgi:phage terminase large subunit